MRRVVVTGLGLVSPLGNGVEHAWKRLINGESGLGPITRFDAKDMACKIAAQVPLKSDFSGEAPVWAFNADDWMEPKEQRKVDTFIVFGIAAAVQAIQDSGWLPQTEEEKCRSGVQIGSGIGGIGTIAEGAITLKERGPRRISPFFIPSSLINLVSGHVSIRFGLKGPNHSAVTACATGVHAIGDAARLIMRGDADVMVAGGSEAGVAILVPGARRSRGLVVEAG